MTIRSFSAGGALPIKNAIIRISGADEVTRFVEFSVQTDINGVSPKITLPAPAKSLSLSPSPAEVPYALYNIEITKDGYYTKRINNVAVFSGTDAFQLVNMIPVAVYENGVEYPRDTLDSTVIENPYL